MDTKNEQSVGQTRENGQSQGVAAVAAGSALLDKLESELRAIKDAAVEASAGSPPEGYTELNPIHGVVADRCWQHGLDAMETAIANWIYDQRHNEPNIPHHQRARTEK